MLETHQAFRTRPRFPASTGIAKAGDCLLLERVPSAIKGLDSHPPRPRFLFMSKHHGDHKRSKDSVEPMLFDRFSFGSICINGTSYEHDVVIDRGRIRKRDKKPSKKFRDGFGHTPLSIEEEIPWKCHRLVIGTGGGALPVMREVKQEAARREIELIIVPTEEAVQLLKEGAKDTNAILHVTC